MACKKSYRAMMESFTILPFEIEGLFFSMLISLHNYEMFGLRKIVGSLEMRRNLERRNLELFKSFILFYYIYCVVCLPFVFLGFSYLGFSFFYFYCPHIFFILFYLNESLASS